MSDPSVQPARNSEPVPEQDKNKNIDRSTGKPADMNPGHPKVPPVVVTPEEAQVEKREQDRRNRLGSGG